MFHNVYEFSSSDEEDEVAGQYQPRRERLVRDRIDFFNVLSENQFFARFRLRKLTVLNLLDMIQDQISTATNMNDAVSPMNRLLLTLRFYATGCFTISAGDFIGVSKTCAFGIIEEVTEPIVSLRHQHIYMPNSQEEMTRISGKFFQMARFPRVIGVVDGTHIRMQSIGGNFAETYRNRKGYFSKNVLVVAGPDLEIQHIITLWPGSIHDQTVFNGSSLEGKFVNQDFANYHLLGDSGYECRSYLMTPVTRVMNPEENSYNESLIRTRVTVERLFGVWKKRFPILSLGIRVSEPKAVKADFYIMACAVLHNIACRQREGDPPEEIQGLPEGDNLVNDEVVNDGPVGNNPRYENRLRLINGWFANLHI